MKEYKYILLDLDGTITDPMMAVISSMLWGFSPTQTPVMPVDSIWNTPLVLPSESIL